MRVDDGLGLYGDFMGRAARHFATIAFRDCRPDHAARYVVKGILAPGDLALIFGQPGAGKSLLSPLLAHAIASGREVFGRRVRQGAVLYIAAEAGADMEVRFVALRERHGQANGLHLLPAPLNLLDPAGSDLRALQEVIEKMRPQVVFIDTLAASFPGLMENEASDMGRAVRALRDLSEPSGAAVVAVHHAPKSGETPRGHGLLNGDCDVTLRVEGQDDEVRRVVAGKNRNGPSGPLFSFGMELVDLGTDVDGDVIRRPVAVETDALPDTAREKRRPTGAAGRALDLLINQIAIRGEQLPHGEGFPSSPTMGVPEKAWRAAFYAGMPDADAKPDTQRKAFQRASLSLLNARLIGLRGELAWLV
jgi:archaellum biogenesis ATPase FlaH